MKKQIINEQPIGTVLTGMTKGALKGALRNAFKSVLENSDNVVTDILRKEAKIAATETLDSATDILIKQLPNLSESAVSKLVSGLLRTKGMSREILEPIVDAVMKNEKFIGKYITNKEWLQQGEKFGEKAILRHLKESRGYSDDVLLTISNKLKNNHAFMSEMNKIGHTAETKALKSANRKLAKEIESLLSNQPVQQNLTGAVSNTTTTAGKNAATTASGTFSKLGGKVKAAISAGRTLMKIKWALYLGLVGAAGYYLWDQLFRDISPAEIKKMDDFATCILPLIETSGGKLSHTSGGDLAVVLKVTGNPEYDALGGVIFYDNGRVWSVDRTKKGGWSCNGGQVAIQESLDRRSFIKNLLLEQSIEMTDSELGSVVNQVIDLLDFPSSYSDMNEAYKVLTSLKGKTYNGKPAGPEFLDLYQSSGLGGGNLPKTIKYLAAIDANTVLLKKKLLRIAQELASGASDGINRKGINGVTITWDGDKKPGITPSPGGKKYKPCTDFPFNMYCKNQAIGDVQKCLGIKIDNMFGPNTNKAIKDGNYYGTGSEGVLTKEIYDKIMSVCNRKEVKPIDTTPAGIDDSIFVTSPEVLVKTEPNRPPESILNAVINGVKVGDIIGSKNITPSGNRIKYKGDELEPQLLNAIDLYYAIYGYGRLKQVPKEDYEMKYVWLKK